MSAAEKEILRDAFALLLDASLCARVKLGITPDNDTLAEIDFFEAAPAEAIRRATRRLRELDAQH